MPSLVSISAEIQPGSRLLGKNLNQVEERIGASLVMLERPDPEGELHSVPVGEIGGMLEGDRIFLILEIDDIGQVEKFLGS